ncbi:MAG TPA: FMN-binding protein [Steroidobacteraceae bacterium]|nr:FMN-binding protein [Steroidobacteraceae bacterium]HRX88260.1 FMN-binding protein [Steroidobacteraceae bacterium]
MYSRFLLVPAAAVVFVQPAVALDIQTLAAAQQRLFPGATLVPADFSLSPENFERLKRIYQVPALRPAVKAWRVAEGGWLFLDQVYGLNDIVTYLVAVNADGAVKGIEILVCAEGYCGVTLPEWRAEFVGKTHGKWHPSEAVTNISGTTLSSTHIAEGVKKILAIHARFLPN